ncbi:MAG: hypothetical protein U1F36_00485 [Planctomycetota bacterium]
MNTKNLLVLCACGLGLLVAACGTKSEPAKPKAPISFDSQPTDSEAMKTAKEKFKTICATCHGLTGHGDGAAAAAMNPKPRSYTDQSWQASVTDEHIKKIIAEGGAAVGKSPLMTGDPSLKGNEPVLNAMVEIIRSYRQ